MERFGFAKNAAEAENEDYTEAKGKVMNSLKDFFRPEFLNRVDDIILFDILSKESIEKIVSIQVNLVIERLKAKDINLVITPDVLTYLAKEGYNPHYGARPLKRLIQNKILTPVANLMISQGITKGGTITVTMKKGTEEFQFDVKNKKKAESALVMSNQPVEQK
jgi:ATP-dependent Clp protease ATP-binding subunit ClpA